jgi:two-component system LytT family response regulator
VLEALSADERPRGIIFVTAYDAYAIRAFDVNAIDYLLKPYSAERFGSALNRARERLADPASAPYDIEGLLRAVAARNAGAERLAVKTQEGVRFIGASEIDWLQADGNYTVIHSGTATLRTREALTAFEERLSPHGFIRVHRSVVINADRIFRLEPWTHGEYVIVLRNGTKLNSSRAYAEQIRRLIEGG